MYTDQFGEICMCTLGLKGWKYSIIIYFCENYVLTLTVCILENRIFPRFWKLAKKYTLVVMNYPGIFLEYLRSVECKFSPLGDLSGGTHTQ